MPRSVGSLLWVAACLGACTIPGSDPSTADPHTGREIGQPRDESLNNGDGGVQDEDDAEAPVGVVAELVRVVDGDSLELMIDGEETDVRLAAYNAPELYRPQSESGAGDRSQRQCNGEQAAAALEELVAGASLTVIGQETDRFGRLLADVRLDDGFLVSERMVESGWGLSVGGYSDDGLVSATTLRDRMKQAAAEQRGMWGSMCGVPQTTALRIGDVQPDPPGSDRDNLNDEWVQIQNRTDQPVEVEGWVVRDDTTGHRFTLTGTVAPGSTLTVRSGSGSSSNTDFHLGETFPVWSNQGETVLLVDPAGVIVDWSFVD